MDVQTGDTEFRPDPAATAAVPATGSPGQGVLFGDTHGYSAFGDTDKIPAVSGARGGRGRGRGGRNRDRDPGRRPSAPRWLRLAVTLVVVAILGAAAALGLVKAGVLDGNNGGHTASGTHATTPRHPSGPTKQTNSLLTATGTTSSGTVNYTIPERAFGVTVTTSVGRSWVSIGVVGQHPVFAGIVPPNSSQHEILLGQAQVQVGAGGTKVIISTAHKSQTLTPPSAPFSYQISPA